MKIEHERKLSSLQSQEYKGEDESKLNKTKASINKLHSLIVVTSQAVSTTSTAIVGLRDAELVPQLVELCHGYVISRKKILSFRCDIHIHCFVLFSYTYKIDLFGCVWYAG